MTTARRLHHTYEEYLGALEMSGVKLEFCDGEIYAMAGGTPSIKIQVLTDLNFDALVATRST